MLLTLKRYFLKLGIKNVKCLPFNVSEPFSAIILSSLTTITNSIFPKKK